MGNSIVNGQAHSWPKGFSSQSVAVSLAQQFSPVLWEPSVFYNQDVPPVQVHEVPCKGGPHPWNLMLYGGHLEIDNNFIFEFVL